MSRRGENIYKRKDGRYEGRYIKYRDVAGKAVYGYLYSKSYSDIKQQLAKCKNDADINIKESNTLLSSWMDTWINSKANLKPTTKQIYLSHIKNHIKIKLGNIPLKKLNHTMLQNFIDSLDLSSSTTKTIFTILKGALSVAEDSNLIGNIWSKIKLPKKAKAKVQILSINQQKQLEEHLNKNYDIGILICLYTGLRIGEMCALKWSNINFDTATISVNGTQTRTKSGVANTVPKSKISERDIPLPNFLISRLKKMKKDSEYVLSKNNKATDLRTYRRYFKSVLRKSNLPIIKYHALRHPYVKLKLKNNQLFFYQ